MAILDRNPMTITEQAEADAYLTAAVEKIAKEAPDRSREQILATLKGNIAYFAGYYDDLTRARVERLFHCAHPIFGPIATKGRPSPEEAFAMGVAFAKSRKNHGETP